MLNEPLNPNLPYWTNGGGLALVLLLILLIALLWAWYPPADHGFRMQVRGAVDWVEGGALHCVPSVLHRHELGRQAPSRR